MIKKTKLHHRDSENTKVKIDLGDEFPLCELCASVVK